MPGTKNPAKPTTVEAVITTQYDSKPKKLPALRFDSTGAANSAEE
jgi:hypothetical protein